MRDLVESVIDGILLQERIHQQTQGQKTARAATAQPKQRISRRPQLYSAPSGTIHASHHKDDKLWKASLQFEAIFMQQMMSAMRKSVPKSDFIKQGFAEDVHAAMMDEAIAQAGARRGTLGIAETIYRQLEEDQLAKTQGISDAADTLHMSRDIAAEVNSHAH
jgi:nucleoid-associated protein YgaU